MKTGLQQFIFVLTFLGLGYNFNNLDKYVPDSQSITANSQLCLRDEYPEYSRPSIDQFSSTNIQDINEDGYVDHKDIQHFVDEASEKYLRSNTNSLHYIHLDSSIKKYVISETIVLKSGVILIVNGAKVVTSK